MISETKIEEAFLAFLSRQSDTDGYLSPYRIDWIYKGGGIIIYVRENILSKLIEIRTSIKSVSVELNLRKKADLRLCADHATLMKPSTCQKNLDNSSVIDLMLTLFRMGILGANHGWGAKKVPLPKICHTYLTMTQLYLT